MKVPIGQTVEECIRDDVHDLVVKTGRVPKLAYLVNWGDATNLLQRLKPDIADVEFHARDFELHTEGGLVRVIGDRYAPRGAVYRMVICACGALSLYMPGVDQCLNCLTLKPRPYAPGEKMTDRHPDSVIAQVVEETIAARNDGPPCDRCGKPTSRGLEAWAARHQACSPYAPAPVSPELLAHRDHLVRETHEAMGMPADLFRGIDRSATPEKLSGALICTTPGYNAVFRIDPDPPDLSERRAARVADHQRREMQERGPFDYDVPSYAGILKAPYEQPARPDGFDQHQVDAAKAALLVPAPPRYPRAR